MTNKHLFVAFFLASMAVWVLSGNLSSEPVSADVQTSSELSAQIRHVRGIKSLAGEQEVFLKVRGQTKPNRVVQVKSEIAGKIEGLPGEKGRRVEKGQLLCRIAVDARRNEYRQALAELQSSQLEFDGFVDLKEKGLQSEVLLAKARAALEQSKTRAKHAHLALEKTEIVAPFTGVVDMQFVEVGDFLSPGETCVTLMEVNPILIFGQVAEKNIGQIALDDKVDVNLITNQTLTGKVSYIGYSPDLKTRTFPVEVTVENPGAAVRAGLTAEMRVPVGVERAHLISPASMVLDDEGEVGVRIVDSSSRVRFRSVTVVGESPAGVFVSGLPDEIDLITVGHEEVFEGQEVILDLTPLVALAKQ